jgi:hypothetical protein
VSRKRDREIADEIREMIALGDPNWRTAALAHLKDMMQRPDSAKTVAGVIKVLSERAKTS